MISRDEAFALVEERIPQRNLVNHCVAAEIIMGTLARRLGKCDDEVVGWELAGLLHDLDYAETADDPARHGLITAEQLEGLVDERIIHAILAHAEKAPRESDMDKALWCADPTTGFIVAAALVRPEKDLLGVQLKSLKKRWKESAFAKGASRDQMGASPSWGSSATSSWRLRSKRCRSGALRLGCRPPSAGVPTKRGSCAAGEVCPARRNSVAAPTLLGHAQSGHHLGA